MELHSSLLKKAITFPQHLKSQRQVMCSAIAKQGCALGMNSEFNEPQLVRTRGCEDIPELEGRTVLLALMDWNMYTHEDACIISESLAQKLITAKTICKSFVDPYKEITATVKEGDVVKPYQAVGMKADGTPCFMNNNVTGRCNGVSTYKDDVEGIDGNYLDVAVECAYDCVVGSKLSNLHSCKSIVSKILPDERMPQMLSGTPAEMMISPMSIGNRVNPSLIVEGMLGMYCERKGTTLEYDQFDKEEMNLMKAGDLLDKVIYPRNCKFQLKNGVRGREFPNKTFVGRVFLMRLHFHPEDKLSWQNDVREDHTGMTVSGIGNTRYGREEVEILYQYDCGGVMNEMIRNSKKSSCGQILNGLIKTLGYEYEL